MGGRARGEGGLGLYPRELMRGCMFLHGPIAGGEAGAGAGAKVYVILSVWCVLASCLAGALSIVPCS